MSKTFRIDRYRPSDRPALYEICLRTVAFEAALAERWLPDLRELYPLDAAYPSADAHYVRLVHESPGAGRPWLPDYPAHLHVDLLPEAQGGGPGRALLGQFFAELRARGVPGVHVGVSSDNPGAIGFYEHIGMSVLARGTGGQAMGMRLRR